MYRRTILPTFSLFLLLLPSLGHAAIISIDPATGTYGPGDTFIAAIRLNTEGQCINAGKVELQYPKDVVRVVDVSRGDSIFSLWVEEPTVDKDTGTVSFSGGTPGGYCGKIQGDPADTNVLARIVFTVLKTDASSASLDLTDASEMYLNDGHGTKAALSEQRASYALTQKAMLPANQWLEEVQSDTTPPEPFSVSVESDEGVFGGAFFASFSTIDKQSGIDHYEILENGNWKPVESPHKLDDQSLQDPIEVKAIDKAGNERLAVYVASNTPQRASRIADFSIILLPLLILSLLLVLRYFILGRRNAQESAPKP